MPPILQILTGKKAGTKFPLVGPTITIGRHPECDIPLDGNSVSRLHAQLLRVDNGYSIEDQKSRNGTLVNGLRIAKTVRLANDDRVKICETLFVYREEPETPTEDQFITTAETINEDDRPSTVVSTVDLRDAKAFLTGVRPEAKLNAIFEISQAIAHTLDLDSVFNKILESSFRIFPQVDRGMVIEAIGGRLIPRASKQRNPDEDSLRFSRTIVQRALEEKKAILSADASSDERFSLSESIADFRIRSIMCVPLLGVDQRPLGVIQLDTQSYTQRFGEDDLQVLVSMSNQASIAMENARLHEQTLAQERIRRELSFAREVQQRFLPRSQPVVPGYSFWAYYEAAGQIGGDYYDFVSLPNGRQAVIVADVSGKGVPAALLMARISSDAKVALITRPDDPADAVTELNRQLCDANLDDRFVTMTVAVVDPKTHRVQTVSAGHMSPMVRRRNGSVDEPTSSADAGSLPLGILPDAVYQLVEIGLEPGERIVCYSDGINDAMSTQDEAYTSDRLRKLLSVTDKPAAELGELLIADVRAFAEGRGQHDDMTLVVFSRDS